MYKAVVFDCFGVLVRDGWLPFLERHFSNRPDAMAEALDLNKQVDRGFITFDAFTHELAVLAGISQATVLQQLEQNPANAELFTYVRQRITPHYKVGMLSNAGGNWLDSLFTPQDLKLFDATALSYEIGVIKPDAEAYEIIADRLGVSPKECIFIDDQERYAQGATDAGMTGLQYISNEQIIARLNDLLGSRL